MTSNYTAGRYPIKITLSDDAPTSRGGSKSTIYQFDLYVRFRPFDFSSDSSDNDINKVVTVDQIYPVLPDPDIETDSGSASDTTTGEDSGTAAEGSADGGVDDTIKDQIQQFKGVTVIDSQDEGANSKEVEEEY